MNSAELKEKDILPITGVSVESNVSENRQIVTSGDIDNTTGSIIRKGANGINSADTGIAIRMVDSGEETDGSIREIGHVV